MSLEENDTITESMGTKTQLVACIPLLALAAIAAWFLLARPSAQAAPAANDSAMHVAAVH